jgi:chitodextrinase
MARRPAPVRVLRFILIVIGLSAARGLVAPPGAAAAVNFVQVNSATPQTPQTTVAVTYAAAQSDGDLNIVAVGWSDAIHQVTSVTDSRSNIYVPAVGPTINSASAGAASQTIYYAKNITAAPAGGNTVTVTFNGPVPFADIRILEYGGVDITSPVDVTAAAIGNSATSSTPAVTTTNANDLLFAANVVATLTAAPGGGFTSRIITTPDGDIAEDRLVSATGSYSASAPLNQAGQWVMQLVAFRVAGSAPPVADTTPPAPPSNLTATAGSTQINLAWTASTDNVGVTGYQVERCQGAGCGNFVALASSTTATFSDTGLTASTSYSYRVRATDAAGNLSLYSNIAGATTTAPPTPPGTITFVQVNAATPQTAQTAVGVTYAAAQSAGDLNVVVVGWSDAIHQVASISDSRSNIYVSAVGPTVNSASAGAASQTIYYAKNITAAPAGGNTVTVTFNGPVPFADIRILEYAGVDTTVPVDVTAAAIGNSANSSTPAVTTTNANDLLFAANVVATLTAAPGAGYTSRIITSPDGDIAEDRVVSATGSYDASASLSQAGQWVMQLVAFRVASSSPPPTDTTPPTAPSNLTATAGSTQINLAWTASTDNVGVTGYQVERCQGAGCSNFVALATPTTTTFGDAGLVPSTAYSYRVRSTDAAGNLSSYSDVVRATTMPVTDTTPPTAPSNLTATAGSTQINLAWTASTDNVGVTGYQLERCQGSGCSNFAPIATPTTTTFGDTGLAMSTSYSYRVRATDATGNLSLYSNTVTAVTTTTQTNPVVIENQQPGSSGWQLGSNLGRPYATDSVGQIKGYASGASVNKGESITLYVSVNTAQTYTIDVYRIGWYQGLGGRLMQHIGPLNAIREATCPMNASTGMIECNWTPAYVLATQISWTSGIYLAVLRNAQGFYNYIVFTVRDDSRIAALLYQQPVTTYQAYNNYPDDKVTGKSLYDYNSYGAPTVTGTARAVKVSFDRPYKNEGAGDFIWESEINIVRWLEKSGYDVTYSTDIDTHTDGGRLLNYRGFLSLPHDEYWSRRMYDVVVAARDAGVNLGFFGANAIYWQVRFESSSRGVANRVLVCYRSATLDPIADPALKTVRWRDAPLSRPEQTLVGVEYTDGPQGGSAPYVVTNSTNWVYAGTGFRDGDSVPRIVGYEADRVVSGNPAPIAVSGTYVLLSRSPYTGFSGSDYSNSSVYQAPSGAWVFATGTMAWGWALDDLYPPWTPLNTIDVRIQRATKNVLDRFISR